MTDPAPHKSRVPHWGWWLLATVVLVVVGVVVRFGVSVNQQRRVVAHFATKGADVLRHAPPCLQSLPSCVRGHWIELFSRIAEVYAGGTEITDQDLLLLKEHRNIGVLVLNNTRVTDNGLQALRGLRQLDVLGLGRTGITDVGLEDLSGLKSLTSLTLWETRCTPAGVAKLKAALPDCRIVGP